MNKPINLIPPVLKSVRVARAQADAFRLYTEGLGKWWPLKTHSIGGEKAVNAVMEPRQGGRLYEVWEDGSIHPYGEVLPRKDNRVTVEGADALTHPDHAARLLFQPRLEGRHFTGREDFHFFPTLLHIAEVINN